MKKNQLREIIKEDLQEQSKGLWYHINRNQEQGKKPAKKGSKAFKAAKSAAKRINAQK